MRIGRPAPEQLHDVQVDLDGVFTPLKALAQVYVRPPMTLLVSLHDVGYEAAALRAIGTCGLELNPTVETGANGVSTIVVPFPKPTRELREGIIKQAKTKAEDCKTAIRHARKLWMDALKKATGGKDDIKKVRT